MQINGFAGVLVPQTVTVYIADNCEFRDGWSRNCLTFDGSQCARCRPAVEGSAKGNTVLVGHYVDDLD